MTGHRFALVAIGVETALLVLALALGWLWRVPVGAALTPSVAGLVAGTIAIAPLLGLLWWVTRSTFPPFRRLVSEVDEHLLPLFRTCTLPELALIAVAAGVGEEALFRGLIQLGVGDIAGIWVGIAVASVAFGLAHLVTPTYAALAALIGVYLGVLAVLSGGIWAPVVAHAGYDFVALALWVRAPRPSQPEPTAKEPPLDDPR